MLCLSGFEVYSRWVPLEKLKNGHEIWSIWRTGHPCSLKRTLSESHCFSTQRWTLLALLLYSVF